MTEQIPSHPETPRWVERELTHSRNVIANAKVVVTFSAALAATFASAALDPKEGTGWDEWAVRLMLLTLAVTVIVVLLRARHRRGELDHDPARTTALVAYWLMILQVGLAVATIFAVVAGKRNGLWH
jgi:peptidoglycan biosynthesis protein MviN/MurJ (putative lipid II flippase)